MSLKLIKDLFIEKVTKHSSKTLLCLVTFSMNKSLTNSRLIFKLDPAYSY